MNDELNLFILAGHKILSVILVNKVDNDFDHCILFFGATFSNHQGEGNKGVVSDPLGAVLIVENAVTIEKP